MLLIDKVTETYDAEDGRKVGVVLGGTPISYAELGDALGCHKSTTKRATKFLCDVGLIAREQGNYDNAYTYYVLTPSRMYKKNGLLARGVGQRRSLWNSLDRTRNPETQLRKQLGGRRHKSASDNVPSGAL